MKTIETQVAIIGGGVTGAGTLRDLALRGIPAVLVEKGDLASGTSGRNHGLLHSGSRYAVGDPESARECIAESRVLKVIARHTVEDTGGLFVTLPGDDPGYADRLIRAGRDTGIEIEEIPVSKALRMEPHLNPAITRALLAPDATIDPFRLTMANVLSAVEHGQQALTHVEATSLIREGDRVAGILCRDRKTGERFAIRSRMVVNAAGIWGRRVCQMANLDLAMHPSKGSMLIIDYRVNRVVINRSRPASDGDIIVPGDTVSLLGTTSRTVDYDAIDDLRVDDDEIDVLLKDAENLIPRISRTRALRAYAGVRPLLAASEGKDGREISRGLVLIDHETRDGLAGLVTMAGGKLTTYRLMAEKLADYVAEHLGVNRPCETRQAPLPGSEKPVPIRRTSKKFTGVSESVVGSTHYRHGERVHQVLGGEKANFALVCECEMVTAGEVRYAIKTLGARDLIDLRRRTRLGMGPCQGGLCAYRAAGLMEELGAVDADTALTMLAEFLEERYKGVRPVLWGDGMREMEFIYWLYEGLFGLGAGDGSQTETQAPERDVP
jgi:glycerol-3-phosphate dehydrogenase